MCSSKSLQRRAWGKGINLSFGPVTPRKTLRLWSMSKALELGKGLEHMSGAGGVQLGEKEEKGGPHHSTTTWKEDGGQPFSQEISSMTRRNSLKLHQGRFKLHVKENFLHQKGCQALNRLPREVLESPALEGFKRHVYVALGIVRASGGLSSAGLMLDLMNSDFFQRKWFCSNSASLTEPAQQQRSNSLC